MIKRVLRLIVLVFIIIGICLGVWITIKRQVPQISQKEIESKIFSRIQVKTADITSFYTYGRAFNIKGKMSNVNKDNFESVKLVITDGKGYEKEYNLNNLIEENTLFFSSDKEINSGVILDQLSSSEYYIFLRLKLNNSVEPKYYSFSNKSDHKDIEYYTVTSENKNKKILIGFNERTYQNQKYNILTMKLQEENLPENVYDIVIDAGHGGKDKGETKGNFSEADIVLEYAKLLKASLDEAGYKVKLTRDETNSENYTSMNMYDSDGRITQACKTKAKLMISFHINQGNNGLKGLEIYSPSNCDLEFANEMSNKIKEYSNIEYSNNNSFKKNDGVYVRNFTNKVIKEYENTAKRKGYEPYNITTNTPYLYTIREVGGIATGAYVDGRNTDYSANEYYNSNQGIECYQIELGYIKNDLDIIINEKANYIRAITEAISNNY